MPNSCLMARQPILDRAGEVQAYEILYRGPAPVGGALSLAEERRSVLSATAEIGLGRLVGERPAFFNVSSDMLGDECVGLLPPDRVVLELLETTVLDEETGRQMDVLREKGYRLAYDDFTFARHQIPFVGRVEIVKVDVLDTPWGLIEAGAAALRRRGATLLAEKVEDREVYERCMRLGFELFQGYYFARPETLAPSCASTGERSTLRLLSVLNDPSASVAHVADAVARDASLAARILRLASSVALGCGRGGESIHAAVQMLGVRRMQAFASMLAASRTSDPSAGALSELGFIRARVCEEVARQTGEGDPHRSFTVGLLTVLSALMRLPMGTIVEELGLCDEVSSALLDPEGFAPARAALALERGDWAALEGLRLNVAELMAVYLRAVAEAAALG